MKSISPQKAKRTLDYLERRKQSFNRKYIHYDNDKKKLDDEIHDLTFTIVEFKCAKCGNVMCYTLYTFYSNEKNIDDIDKELCSDCGVQIFEHEIQVWFSDLLKIPIKNVGVKEVDRWNGYIIFQIHGNELKIDLREYYKAKQ
jgi:hypothetical protein